MRDYIVCGKIQHKKMEGGGNHTVGVDRERGTVIIVSNYREIRQN